MPRLAHHVGIERRPIPERSANDLMRIPNHQKSTTTTTTQKHVHQQQHNTKSFSNSHNAGLVKGEIPYVTPDGGKTRYYADRFYLDAPTSLIEYQLANNNNNNSDSLENLTQTQPRNQRDHPDYCNRCGEIRSSETRTTYRGTNKDSSKAAPPQTTQPLFDRAKFINSLDLSAAIIGTYTIGAFDHLSHEFPSLFPRKGGCQNRGGRHVPTLVLHGQKGFCMDKWSSSSFKKNCNAGTADIPKQQYKEHKVTYYDSSALGIRGGGGEGESSSSQEEDNMIATQPATQPPLTPEQVGKKKSSPPPTSSGRKRPIFTYENQTFQLPKTPKRLRMYKKRRESRKKKKGSNEDEHIGKDIKVVHENIGEEEEERTNTENNCRGHDMDVDCEGNDKSAVKEDADVAIANQKETKSTKEIEVIIIDSDESYSENDETDTKKPPASSIPTKSPPPQSPPAAAPAKGSLSPPLNNQQPQKCMPMDDNDAPPRPPNLSNGPAASTSYQSRKIPAPGAPTSGRPSSWLQQKGVMAKTKTMRPIFYHGGHDSSQDTNSSGMDFTSSHNINTKAVDSEQLEWGGVKSESAFDGEVFFTQVLPRWIPPSTPREREDQMKKQRAFDSADKKDDMDINNREKKSERGVHHPKFYLLFERSGSLVVIISSSNLTPQNSTEGTWLQRFEPNQSGSGNTGKVDYGMASDFGHILTDFLQKQSEAAEDGSLSPDIFLRRYAGLTSGLNSLSEQYQFDKSQVHLVSTVPGDYISGLPRNVNRSDAAFKSCISYGPQRVSYILSRVLNKGHIDSAKMARNRIGGSSRTMETTQSWLCPNLKKANERLIIQPTSLGGNWTTGDLETIVKSYLQPHWVVPDDSDDGHSSPLDLLDIVWPSMDYFDIMKSRRESMKMTNPELATNDEYISEWHREIGESHVFLSSVNFAKMERPVISRMKLFTHLPKVMPYKSTSLHIKSVCRLLRLGNENNNDTSATLMSPGPPNPKEYLSWFLLTSACLSRGARGQPTPYRDPATDSMSYSNFELGVLFTTRMVGDNVYDRLYVSDSNQVNGCQCGVGKRMYKPDPSRSPNFLDSVRKVHLPIPYMLRPKPYQEDPESDFLSYTPYMQINPDTYLRSGCVGNMKLTPIGQKIASDLSKET